MIAHEKTERTSRMHSTTRATQPVCVISVSSWLEKTNCARTEIVLPPRKKFCKKTHKQRSTRTRKGQTNQQPTGNTRCSSRHREWRSFRVMLWLASEVWARRGVWTNGLVT